MTVSGSSGFATSRAFLESSGMVLLASRFVPSVPHDRHKRAKTERRATCTHFPLTVDLLIVTADYFPRLATATLPRSYTLTGNSAVVPPACCPL